MLGAAPADIGGQQTDTSDLRPSAFCRTVDVDSTGPYPPERLLPAAIGVLTDKIQTVLQGLDALEEEMGISSF